MSNPLSDQGRNDKLPEHWDSGATYELYVGRWSRPVARDFLEWLDLRAGARWIDVGCGTGALSESILRWAAPSEVKGVDRSAAFVAFARQQVADARVSFEVSDAQQLPFESGHYDAAVGGLVLNFIPEPAKALREMARVVKSGGVVAAYVWDYADRMQMMRFFWDAVIALHPDVPALDEGRRFPLCNPESLGALFRGIGLDKIDILSIEIPTHFQDFDDLWTPILGGQGPAPTYAMSLTESDRDELRDHLRSLLPINADGSIDLYARAWAARGFRPA